MEHSDELTFADCFKSIENVYRAIFLLLSCAGGLRNTTPSPLTQKPHRWKWKSIGKCVTHGRKSM